MQREVDGHREPVLLCHVRARCVRHVKGPGETCMTLDRRQTCTAVSAAVSAVCAAAAAAAAVVAAGEVDQKRAI